MSDGDYKWRFECVGGPLDGERFSVPETVHDNFFYEFTPADSDVRAIQGSSRYELRRGEDGTRRFYHIRLP